MKFGSLFTGIGGFDLGFERAGMTCAWQVEIDKACQKVLAHHWPDVKRMTDVKEVGKHNLDPVDVICGGFPCQDLSVAGRRAGLAGERSGLWFEFHRILAEMLPQWVVIENVPGLLSSNGGRDFAVILRGLVQLGYGVAWRVLDAQYFGVAQRRRRVFIVGHLGDGRAAEVLFEREGGAWDTSPSREKGQRVAPTLGAESYKPGKSSTGQELDWCITGTLDGKSTSANRGSQANETEFIVPVAMAVNAHPSRRYDAESETFVAYTIQQNDNGSHKRKDRPAGGMYVKEADAALTVGGTDQTVITEIHGGSRRKDRPSGGFYVRNAETTKPLDTSGLNPNCAQGGIMAGVRRLTPTECERLQGFPDGWTAGQADGPRYRQLGNAVCVPVIEWIGRRIVNV